MTAECREFLGRKLYRIRALIAFGDIKEGDLGGWIEKEENLSQENNARVYDNDEWLIHCDNCGLQFGFGKQYKTKNEAIKAWNDRILFDVKEVIKNA